MTQSTALVGPPESRNMQRKMGISVYIPPAGAIKLPCDTCGSKTWIGPAQLAAKVIDPSVTVMCFACALKLKGQSIAIKNLGGKGGTYKNLGGTTWGPINHNDN